MLVKPVQLSDFQALMAALVPRYPPIIRQVVPAKAIRRYFWGYDFWSKKEENKMINQRLDSQQRTNVTKKAIIYVRDICR